jgi:DNA-binding GntR family transcriptional regulator
VSEPHKGVTVPLLDIADVKAVYITRRLIEPYAFARASRRFSRLDLACAHELTDAMEAANLAGDPSGVSVANRAFHFLFFERCGIPGLTARLEELWDAFPWDMLMSTDRQHAVEEHRVILKAFEQDDLEQLRRAVEEHLSRSYFRVHEFLQGAPSATDPFELTSD